jgi:hypothetical protein
MDFGSSSPPRPTFTGCRLTNIASADDAMDSPAARLLRDVLRRCKQSAGLGYSCRARRRRLAYPPAYRWCTPRERAACRQSLRRLHHTCEGALAHRYRRAAHSSGWPPEDSHRPGQIEEYRVSTLPTLFGETTVLRRLDSLPANLALASLGFEPEQQAIIFPGASGTAWSAACHGSDR